MTDIVFLEESQDSAHILVEKMIESEMQKTFSKGKQSTKYSKQMKQKILLQNGNSFDASDNDTNLHKNKDNIYIRRLIQNRQSAKKSRLKKKEHLNQLEEKSKTLVLELQNINKQLIQAQKNLEKYIQNNTIDGFNIGRKQTYDRLSHLIEDENHYDQDQINLLLDTLKHRIGATGKERQSKLNYYFKKMLDACIPSLHRYLMWSSSQKIQLFNEKQTQSQTKWTKQLFDVLKISAQQKRKILNLSDRFSQRKNSIEQNIINIHNQKSKLDSESAKIQNTIQEMRKCLTPVQSSKFILFIQNYKYKKQMSLWAEKNQYNQDLTDFESKIKKKIKMSDQ